MKNFAHFKFYRNTSFNFLQSLVSPVLLRMFAFLPTGAQRGRPMMKKTMEMARMTRVLWGLRVGYWSMTPVRTVSNMANYGYNQKLNRIIQKLII